MPVCIVAVSAGRRGQLAAELGEVGECRDATEQRELDDDVAAVIVESAQPLSDAIRWRRITAAPLVLISDAPADQRAAALRHGADACVGSREPAELIAAQVKALRRRLPESAPQPSVLKAGSIVLDQERRTVSCGGAELDLTPRLFDLLAHLCAHIGKPQRREAVLAAVWGPRYAGTTNTVDVHIAWLRAKVAPSCGVRITTLRGIGYRLDVLQ